MKTRLTLFVTETLTELRERQLIGVVLLQNVSVCSFMSSPTNVGLGLVGRK